MSSSVSAPSASPTVYEIESQGKWVSVRNNPFGFSADLLHYWRRWGCPYVKGRKLKAKLFTVRIEGQRGRRKLWLFDRVALADIAERFKIDGVPSNKPFARYPQHWTRQATRRKWAECESFVDAKGREWAAARVALKTLHVCHAVLYKWRRYGCPYLGGKPLRSRLRKGEFGRRDRFFLVDQLDEINERRAEVGQAPSGGELLTLDKAASLIGRSKTTLIRWRNSGKLSSETILVRGPDGKVYRQVGIRRSELEGDTARCSETDDREEETVSPDNEPTIIERPERKRRGRPKGRDPEVVQREKDMLADWDAALERGECISKAELGRKHGFDRSDATKLINDHERRKCRK